MLIGLTVFLLVAGFQAAEPHKHQKGSLKTPNSVFRLPWHWETLPYALANAARIAIIMPA